jgi:hypothetical protein
MSATVKITVADLREGRAYIRFPLAAKLNLCHWAGAPWAERKPNAWLHGLQVEVLARKEREKIVHGASRLGKSVLGGCDIIIGLHTHNARVGVFAHRWDHVAHEFRYAHVGVKNIYRGQPPPGTPSPRDTPPAPTTVPRLWAKSSPWWCSARAPTFPPGSDSGCSSGPSTAP